MARPLGGGDLRNDKLVPRIFGKSCRQNILIFVFIAFQCTSRVFEKLLTFSHRKVAQPFSCPNNSTQIYLPLPNFLVSLGMDAKMPMTISALGLEPPKASLLWRFPGALEPLGAILGLQGGIRAAHPAHAPHPARQVGEDVGDAQVGDREASTAPTTASSKGPDTPEGSGASSTSATSGTSGTSRTQGAGADEQHRAVLSTLRGQLKNEEQNLDHRQIDLSILSAVGSSFFLGLI